MRTNLGLLTVTRTSSVIVMLGAALLGACADQAPTEPEQQSAIATQFNNLFEANDAIDVLRAATARYHRLDAAIEDGFVFLHGCENRPDEGPVGAVYVHFGRLLDAKIDPQLPDALIYEPAKKANQAPKLVGVEFAIPYALWTEATPPTFLGVPFQSEDEFGVFGLHVWIWRKNPEGMFAESHPRVNCAEE